MPIYIPTIIHLRHRNMYNKVEDLFIIQGLDPHSEPDLIRRGWRRKSEHNGLVTRKPLEALMIAVVLRTDWIFDNREDYDRLNSGSDLALREGHLKRSRPRLK